MLPNLLNPIDIIIKQVDTVNAEFDHLAREPINQVERITEFKIDGQVKFFKAGDPEADQAGVDEKVEGYVLLRTKDLTTLNKTINRGDKIIKMGNLVVKYYIVKNKPGAQYTDQGGFTLIRQYFVDRDT